MQSEGQILLRRQQTSKARIHRHTLAGVSSSGVTLPCKHRGESNGNRFLLKVWEVSGGVL